MGAEGPIDSSTYFNDSLIRSPCGIDAFREPVLPRDAKVYRLWRSQQRGMCCLAESFVSMLCVCQGVCCCSLAHHTRTQEAISEACAYQ